MDKGGFVSQPRYGVLLLWYYFLQKKRRRRKRGKEKIVCLLHSLKTHKLGYFDEKNFRGATNRRKSRKYTKTYVRIRNYANTPHHPPPSPPPKKLPLSQKNLKRRDRDTDKKNSLPHLNTYSKFLVHIPILTPLFTRYPIKSCNPGCGS